MTTIDPEWRDLDAGKRDILLTLRMNNQLSKAELVEAVGRDQSVVYRHLRTLKNDGLVGEKYVSRTFAGGNPKEYRLTNEARQLVHRGIIVPAEEIGQGER